MKPITNEFAKNLGNEAVMAHDAIVEHVNPLANVWLGLLATVFGLALLCTGILVAWPILAYIGAKFF